METAMPNKNKKISIRQMTMIALMTAVTCILGPLAIPLPFSPVPISFTNLAVYFSLFVLGANSATVSYLVYLLIGMVGLPVFSVSPEVLRKWQDLQGDIWSVLFSWHGSPDFLWTDFREKECCRQRE